MKMKKICLCSTLALTCVAGLSIGHVSMNAMESAQQETRTVEYERIKFDENTFDEFETHEVIQNEEGFKLTATKKFDASIFSEVDFVGLDESEDVTVSYEVNYVEESDTVFLSATIIGEDEIPVIDTIPGLVSMNEKGEADILFAVDDELIWLSDLNDESAIDNTGWFKNLIKKVTNAVVQAASAVVKALAPIIKPAVKIATYCAIQLLGRDNCAAIGAFFLNMGKDDQGIYHADFDCWQQYFGYTDLYDVVFDSATSMRTVKYDFDVNGDNYTDYILWGWKGDYLNLGAGAELGIYERWEYSDEIWKVNKDNAMKMTLKLDHKTKGTLFDYQPTKEQWWITGFDPKTPNVNRDDLTATFTVEFNKENMYKNFKNQWKNDKKLEFSKDMFVKITL